VPPYSPYPWYRSCRRILISSCCPRIVRIPGSWDHSFRRMILISSHCLRIHRIPGSRARSCRLMDSSHSARSCSRTPEHDPGSTTVTINVPVVYMARDVIILMRANPFRGPLEGVGRENQGSPLPMARVMDLPPSISFDPSAK
jgi:hypothetical protein